MLLCPSLRRVQMSYVKFDPINIDHLEAFRILCLGDRTVTGNLIRQHPKLRFELEDGFPDVRSMMFHVVGQYHRNQMVKKAQKKTKHVKSVK